jgi:hypothetical protein
LDLKPILVPLFNIVLGPSFSFSSLNVNYLYSALSLLHISSLDKIISSPTILDEAIDFLELPIFENFEKQFEHSCQLISSNFSQISPQQFSQLTNISLERILS